MNIVDCTLRDGGYYNAWNFDLGLVHDYLQAMDALEIDFIEIGFRSLQNNGFKGGCAYSSDSFLRDLEIPKGLVEKIGVMVNGAELSNKETQFSNLEKLFKPKAQSKINFVRIACHIDELVSCLPAVTWLKQQGYLVGLNLMQIADRNSDEIAEIAQEVRHYPVDVLYFADSMGSLHPEQIGEIIEKLQFGWGGEIGIHTHDNMGQAVANSVEAVNSGVSWVDSTVTGMGRGPGNAQTEFLILALSKYRKNQGNPTKLLELIRKHFNPMKDHYGWGTNPFYYMAGQYGIHPSYIQEMLQDSRYNEEDILAVIDHLKIEGGKKFNLDTLEAARHFYSGQPRGTWRPKNKLQDKTVLVLGSGPGVKNHLVAIELFIRQYRPYVIALNTQSSICQDLIDARAACHPVRLLADCQEHLKLPQPLIMPASMLPYEVKKQLANKDALDFGVLVTNQRFRFHLDYCELPTSLVAAYVLAIASSGQASEVLLAGFDGYSLDDPRRKEMDQLFKCYIETDGAIELKSITPTLYEIPVQSIYGMLT